MSEQWSELFKQLPNFLSGHIMLSLAALGAGLVISVPLGILVSRRPRLAELSLTVAGIIQTVPSLALLALMVLLLGLVGFEPAFFALTLYSILPIVANTVAGLRGVDPNLTEAARGLGMNEKQLLWMVQLPSAAPVIISGIRTAAVMVVGTATLVSPVGGRSLGNYIFQGLESLNYTSALFGCILAALLAVVLDQTIHLFEMAARYHKRRWAWIGGLALAAMLLVGIYPTMARYVFSDKTWVHVGSASFTEQHILSEVLEEQLEPAGFQADKRKSMSEGIQFLALRQNELDCMVNYTGNIWALVMKKTEFADRQTVLREVTEFLRDEWGVTCIPLGFDNAYALAMRRSEAEKRNIRSIADLKTHAPQYTLAADEQILSRPEWFKVRDTYGLDFADTNSMNPSLMYDALKAGQVDVITAYTSDGRLSAYDLVILDDREGAFPPYDAVLLVSPKAAKRPGFLEALESLRNKITQEAMREANRRVDVDKWTYPRAARAMMEETRR